jgi:hypothetical protein
VRWKSPEDLQKDGCEEAEYRFLLGFYWPLTHLFKTCLPTPVHWQTVLQKSHSFLLSSSDTVCVLSLLLYLARNVTNFIRQIHSCLFAHQINLTSHKPPWTLRELCCFGHINGIPLTQLQWYVKAVFSLFTHRKLFFICSSKTTLHGSRIATVAKMQHIYCRQFTEEVFRFTRRIL